MNTPQEYNPSIVRTYEGSTSSLPYSDEDVLIGQNEFLVNSTFNNTIDRILNNLQFVADNAKVYNLPPVSTMAPLTAYDSTPVKLENIMDVATYSNQLYVASDSKFSIYDITSATPTFIDDFDCSNLNTAITEIKSIGVTSSGKVCVLESSIRKVFVLNAYSNTNPTSLTYYSEWGGFGGVTANLKFRTPNDIFIDSSDYIYVADSGNKCVKKYTESGSWLKTIVVDDATLGITPEDGIISVCVDYNDSIQVLTKSKVYTYDQSGNLINTFTLSSPLTPTSIRPMYNSGFLYITYPASILKISMDGNWFGEFSDAYANSYENIIHHSDNTLFVANIDKVSRFVDYNRFVSAINDTYSNYTWTYDDCHVDKDEHIQDWVANRCFHRILDNIEIVKKSLLGRLDLQTNNINGIVQDEVILSDYTLEDLAYMDLYTKEDIYIGINELVTASVLNRCFKMLNDSVKRLISFL